VAVVFQQVAGGDAAYALPVEAIQRVRRDILTSGDLVRGWLGISFRAEIATPQVTRVVPGSPSDKVGIRTNDVILQIGDRVVSDYADSANAFFYLAPGDAVKMRLLRGAAAAWCGFDRGDGDASGRSSPRRCRALSDALGFRDSQGWIFLRMCK